MAVRYYTIDGKRYPSVISILDVLDKPHMVRWAARVAREDIAGEFSKLKSFGSLARADFDTLLAERATAYDYPKNDAANFAIGVHRSIASYVSNNCTIAFDDDPTITAFHQWQNAAKFVPIESEQLVVSYEHAYAGTVDLIGTLNGLLAVLDIKTGRATYPEYKLQLAAYAVAWGEMQGHFPEVCLNLHVKSDSTITEANTFTGADLFSLFQTFLAAKRLFEWRSGV